MQQKVKNYGFKDGKVIKNFACILSNHSELGYLASLL